MSVLTDEQIIRITMRTFRYWRRPLGITLASHVAAARMRRLYSQRVTS